MPELNGVFDPESPAYQASSWTGWFSDVPNADTRRLDYLLRELRERTGVTFMATFSSADPGSMNGPQAAEEQLELFRQSRFFPMPSYVVLVVIHSYDRDPRAGNRHTYAAGLRVSPDLKWGVGIGDDVASYFLRASGQYLDYRNPNPDPTAFAESVCNNIARAVIYSGPPIDPLPPLPPPLPPIDPTYPPYPPIDPLPPLPPIDPTYPPYPPIDPLPPLPPPLPPIDPPYPPIDPLPPLPPPLPPISGGDDDRGGLPPLPPPL